jgi:predicted deacylase
LSKLNINERIIGKFGGEGPGPTVICIGGLHGNEPAGVLALRRVLDQLEKNKTPFRGRLIAVAGNLMALAKGVRFIDQDLNRIWRPGDIDKLISGGNTASATDAEEAERRDLINVFVQSCSKKRSPVYFLDLHTTSSVGSPFITIADTLRNRAFALKYPVPIILGIEERLDSTLLNYINDLGYIAVGFEAGQHYDPDSVENCVAALWITLVNAGCIDQADSPQFEKNISKLKLAARGEYGVYEVRYRHGIENDGAFLMEPGFRNFKRIKKGDLLARSGGREIKSQENGNIFMPLYQKQGVDGFFVIKKINPAWLNISAFLRKLHLESVLTSLPGVQGVRGQYDTIIVNENIARWYVIDFLHLLGYRRKTLENGKLIARKRAFDIKSPEDYSLSLKSINV